MLRVLRANDNKKAGSVSLCPNRNNTFPIKLLGTGGSVPPQELYAYAEVHAGALQVIE